MEAPNPIEVGVHKVGGFEVPVKKCQSKPLEAERSLELLATEIKNVYQCQMNLMSSLLYCSELLKNLQNGRYSFDYDTSTDGEVAGE